MRIRAKRKNRFQEYSWSQKWMTGLLLSFLFIHGLVLSLKPGCPGGLLYIGLWAVSYPVIYWGACRRCVYYGKACPVPLEGSLAQYFFKKSPDSMSISVLIWASVSYGLRIGLPVVIIVSGKMVVHGIIFGGVFLLFWIIHLYLVGCPNCVNENCPFNPDYRGLRL